jgi:methionyl-tRNA formyltransferase
MKSLKIVFLGTPDFAVESLKAIQKSAHQVVGVVTMPDKKMGRGRKLQGSAVKTYAVEHNIHLMQPEKLKNPEFIEELKSLAADLFVVVAFRMLPEMVWNMPELGTVNVHGSLLPQYRGAAPINWAIINGDQETGVTVFRLKHEIDTGDILLRKSIPITSVDNAETVHDKLMILGGQALAESVDLIAAGKPTYLPQLKDDYLRSAPKIYKETCQINWDQKVLPIQDFVRGLSPYPAAWASVNTDGQLLAIKVFKTEFSLEKVPRAGAIETDNKTFLKVSGTNGWVAILELQIAGKKRMGITDLLRGFSFSDTCEIEC